MGLPIILFLNMENHSTFTSKDDFHNDLVEITSKSLDTYSKINIALNQDLCLTNKESYHFISQHIIPKTRAEHILFSMLHRDIYQAETISGNSAKITYVFGMEFLSELLRNKDTIPVNEIELMSMFEKSVNTLRIACQDCATVATQKDIEDVVHALCEAEPDLECAILKAIEAAGIEGKIFVEASTRHSNYIVESKSGYSFNLNPFGIILSECNNKTWDRREPKILIVDGLVEKVSEIDQLLNKAMETKQPLVIVASGFSEEVVSTIKVNNDKKNFDVMPIRMHHDLASINIIRDIGVVCNTTPVTHILGQLLSFVKWDDLVTIDRIVVGADTTTIEFHKSAVAVSEHIRELVAKRQTPGAIEDIRNLISDRLKSLVGHTVTLQLPQMSLVQSDSHRVKIDLSLRNCKTVMNYGSLNLEKLLETYKERLQSPVDHLIFNALKTTVEVYKKGNGDISSVIAPTLSVVLGVLLAGKSCLQLTSSNGVVELDVVKLF